MDSLENLLSVLERDLEESLTLVRTVNSIVSLSGQLPNLNVAQRDSIVEWAFVRVHGAWEEFLESSFITYMVGIGTASGFTPQRYVYPVNEEHALKIILSRREFFPWTSPSDVSRQSTLYFRDGEPFRPALDSAATELQEVNTLRNAIVHPSSVAIGKFKDLVRREMRTAPIDVRPAGFLLADRKPPAGRTYLFHYCNRLKVIAKRIVPL